MSNPSVSVVMPVYNGMPFLPEAVTSILEQTYRDFELIVVNDGSTDETAAYLAGLADSRLHVISLPHLGIVPALNAGLAAAKGTYIARMDADDLSRPQRLQRQVAALEAKPDIGLMACCASHLDAQPEHAGFRKYIRWTNRICAPASIYKNRFVESPIIHPTVMFRSALVDAHGRYKDGDFPEDYELWLRWLAAGVRMEKLDWVGLNWRERPGRLSRTDERYAVSAFYQTKAKYLAVWLRKKGFATDGIIVWGAGRVTRKRCQLLELEGIEIKAFVDIDPRKTGQMIDGRPVWSMEQIPRPGKHFLLNFVANHGARALITDRLKRLGYKEGTHYLHAA